LRSALEIWAKNPKKGGEGMFEKLNQIESRYEELSYKLSQPEVLADVSLMQKLSKEQASLLETVEKYRVK
jgi:peptide chain release factor 1